MITNRRNKGCQYISYFSFIPNGLRVLPLPIRSASLTFRTLSLLDLMSSSDVVSRVIISKKVF